MNKATRYFCGLFFGVALVVALVFMVRSGQTPEAASHRASELIERADGLATDALLEQTTSTQREAAPRLRDIDKTFCHDQCALSLDGLRSLAHIDDAEYEVLLAHAGALTAYLRVNASARSELIDMAISTEDGNKRSLIRTAFSELPIDQRHALGTALLQSSDALTRREGVNFLAAAETLDETTAMKFVALLATEFDTYTKISLIRSLDKPAQFRGDGPIIDGLHRSMRSEINPHLRGEALVVSARLTENPEDIFFDVTSAVNSESEEYRIYGLRALETVLRQRSTDGGELGWQNREKAKLILEALLDQDAVSVPPNVAREASFIYGRHF